MPRPLRIQAEDAIYHVTCRAVTRRALFRDACDWSTCIEILGRVVSRHRWSCLTYCLMTNHYHLIVRTLEPNIAAGMQLLNGAYGRSFNLRHGESGHVFESRYGAELVESDGHLLAAIRYGALNPVRAGACSRPEDWRWSSYAAAVGLVSAPSLLDLDPLLALFSGHRERAQERLRAFVEAAASRTDRVEAESRAA